MLEKYLYVQSVLCDAGEHENVFAEYFHKYDMPYTKSHDKGCAIFFVPFWREKEAKAISGIANLELNVREFEKRTKQMVRG